MNLFSHRIIDTIKHHDMLSHNGRVLIGLSGGPDSVALLLLMLLLQSRFNLTLGIAHINHCLRGDESDRDEMFAEKLAQTHHLPFHLARIDVPARAKREKRSFEEAARLVRYEFYTDLCKTYGYTRVALGHNSNDNAEQVLMNLLRGSGTKGLGGIPPVRPLFDKTSSDESNNGPISASDTTRHGNDEQAAAIARFQVDPSPQNERDPLIIRPLIETSRLEILEWLEEKQQNFVQDSSNTDNRYLRNRIRNELIPHLEAEYNPSLTSSLNRLSHILIDEEAWMEDESQRLFHSHATHRDNAVHLPRKLLKSLHPALARRLVREAIQRVKGDLKRVRWDHIEAIRDLAATKTDGSVLDLPDRIRIIKGYDVICFQKATFPLRTLGKIIPEYLKTNEVG